MKNEKQNSAAVADHRLWFVEEHLAGDALRTCQGDRVEAIALLRAAIAELELPDG